jgi:hypothetical protein
MGRCQCAGVPGLRTSQTKTEQPRATGAGRAPDPHQRPRVAERGVPEDGRASETVRDVQARRRQCRTPLRAPHRRPSFRLTRDRAYAPRGGGGPGARWRRECRRRPPGAPASPPPRGLRLRDPHRLRSKGCASSSATRVGSGRGGSSRGSAAALVGASAGSGGRGHAGVRERERERE